MSTSTLFWLMSGGIAVWCGLVLYIGARKGLVQVAKHTAYSATLMPILAGSLLYAKFGQFNSLAILDSAEYLAQLEKNAQVRPIVYQLKKATVDLELKLTLTPEAPHYWLQLARLYRLQEYYEEAAIAFKKVYELVPEQPLALLESIACEAKQRKGKLPQAALAIVERYRSHPTLHLPAKALLGAHFDAVGQSDRSRPLWLEVKKFYHNAQSGSDVENTIETLIGRKLLATETTQ